MGVLDGIRILELARVAPAELPAMMLADMGAEVLKIETPEPSRDTGDEWVRRTIHTFVNRNKRSMTLNMKSPEGQTVFRKLAATADVIVEGFRPGVMKRLGADYESLRALNPRMVPLIAHDRAGYGGAVCCFGVALFGCVRHGAPSRAL